MKTIALTASTIERGFKLYRRYTDFVLRGAAECGETVCPVILPFTDDAGTIRAYASAFDGYLCTGGDDVDPALYGEQRHPKCGEGEPDRDRFEIALLIELMALDRPVFGICRGIQVMNVAAGGTLWQDIYAQALGPNRAHFENTPDGSGTRHTVYASGNLALLLGACEILTNSYHHQAVKDPGRDLAIAARSHDGLIEAVESTGLTYFKAVQWHPEVSPDEISMKLAADFLAHCG
jgi:putative glutamine amidotransferase